MITEISNSDVHRITSGQVITDLTSAVKELVENSIDSGATRIDLTFNNYGIESFSVSDNGCGIPKEDHEQIALKHYTSKISHFEDVANVMTLGFRGEALSSLCALSSVTIVTATEPPRGTKLVFNQSGHVQASSLESRPQGTTVTCTGLFNNLPVRKKEFVKNARRIFSKMLTRLTAYLLIHNIKITVYHSNPKKNMVISNTGLSIEKNILAIWKTKLQNIAFEGDGWSIKGYISAPDYNGGSREKQYIYINSRPVKWARLAKIINDLWEKVTPMFVLDFSMEEVDVNVTPDKMSVLVAQEKKVLDDIGESFQEWVTNSGREMVYKEKLVKSEPRIVQVREISEPLFEDEKEEISVNTISDVSKEPVRKRQRLDYYERSAEEFCDDTVAIEVVELPEDRNDDPVLEQIELNVPAHTLSHHSVVEKSQELFVENSSDEEEDQTQYDDTEYATTMVDNSAKINYSANKVHEDDDEENNMLPEATELEVDRGFTKVINVNTFSAAPQIQESLAFDLSAELDETFEPATQVKIPDLSRYSHASAPTQPVDQPDKIIINIDDTPIEETFMYTTSVSIKNTDLSAATQTISQKGPLHSFDEEGQMPVCTEELYTDSPCTLSKQDFTKMRVIGQFNLGFILVALNDDIYIVDQHASDEKYNFETLQATTVLTSQKLIVPIELDLNYMERLLVLDHKETFHKNGFHLNATDDKVYLTTLPFSKGTQFDTNDFYELLRLCQDEVRNPRPSKIRSMFAMRACRSSIMIGKSLSRKTMERVVNNLSLLDQPWACPHGRPTIRLLRSSSGMQTPETSNL